MMVIIHTNAVNVTPDFHPCTGWVNRDATPGEASRRKIDGRDQAGALLFRSFQVMESTSAWNEASMILGETPTVVQRSPDSSADSIKTRVTASVPPSRMRTR